MVELVLFFIAGFLWDWLITLDLLLATRGRWIATALTSAALTVLSMTVYAYVIVIDGLQWGRIIALALGAGIGSGFEVWRHHRKERRHDNSLAQSEVSHGSQEAEQASQQEGGT